MTDTSTMSCLHCGKPIATDATACPFCSQTQIPEDPPEAWIGRVVDRKYQIDAVLGVGGMGMVFAATRVLVGDRVALKVLFPRFLESPLQRRLFRDEAIAAARLNHVNVVTVYDADVAEDGTAYIAMELLEGETFKAVLKAHAPMRPEAVLPIAVQVCAGLDAAHQARVIHRDLKPDNIFIEDRGNGEFRVKLVDFGISAMLDADRSDERRQRLGTLRYMAPEQCKAGQIDARADLYALGVVLYEAMTRKRATGKTVSAVLNETPELPNRLLPPDRQMPPPMQDLLMRLLAKKPANRPPTAAAAGEAFSMVLAMLRGEPAPTPTLASNAPMMGASPPPATAAPPSKWPSPMVIGFGVAAVLGIVGGLVWGLM